MASERHKTQFSFSFIFIIFNYVGVCMSADALGGQRLRSPGAEVTDSFVFLRWVLGAKPGSPERAASTLNH